MELRVGLLKWIETEWRTAAVRKRKEENQDTEWEVEVEIGTVPGYQPRWWQRDQILHLGRVACMCSLLKSGRKRL